jgi:hypothetical protein
MNETQAADLIFTHRMECGFSLDGGDYYYYYYYYSEVFHTEVQILCSLNLSAITLTSASLLFVTAN